MTVPEDLIQRLRSGDRGALSRLLTLAENARPEIGGVFAQLGDAIGGAHRVGVTGPPGAGKSTLVGRLIETLRAAGDTVGVLAVDPSSPVSGGALLGDRLRMATTTDDGVFVRSMASRGFAGGLARQSLDVADLIDAFGRDWILVETVGTGQGELDVVCETDTVVVVVHPGAGDGVQAMKSGLFEVADVIVVNKADRSDAQQLKSELEWALDLREEAPPVVLTSATENRGIDDLVQAIRHRHEAAEADGRLAAARLDRTKRRLRRALTDVFAEHLLRSARWTTLVDDLAGEVTAGAVDRHTATARLVALLEQRLGATDS